MTLKYSHKHTIVIMFFFLCLFPVQIKAQTPPIDLTTLSIEDLLNLHISRQSDSITFNNWSDRWSLGYHYVRVKFDDYQDGTDHVSNSKLQNLFAIVPTEIIQEMHMTDITYQASDNLHLSVLLPYIRQQTDHISRISGFERFSICTSGIGDITLSASYLLKFKNNHHFMSNLGISLPIGSIDEKGDTPSPGLRNQLPYTMQLGSGTFDPIFGFRYNGHSGRIFWGASFQSKIHIGRNKRGYSLGDNLLLSAGIRSRFFSEWLEPSVKIIAHISSTIDGCDSDLPTPGLVPVATPSYFGGEKVLILPGLKINFQNGILKGCTLDAEGGLPVYQSTNGPFPGEEWRLSIGFNWSF